MILLLTDFGQRGPYVGEMLARLAEEAPAVPAISLISDLPAFDVRASAYLLAALLERHRPGTVFVVVVDPGVGTTDRLPVWVDVDGRLLVGPDNGVFAVATRRAQRARVHEIAWRPRRLSASFHGRDLFAPTAALLATGKDFSSRPLRRSQRWSRRWPEDLDAVIYVDGFGNAITGRRAGTVPRGARIAAGRAVLDHARTFGAVAPGAAFWYENSMGLVEIAVNRGSARETLGLAVGEPVAVLRPTASGARRRGP